MNLCKIMKYVDEHYGLKRAGIFIQDIFRTRYATDMYISQTQVVAETHKETFGKYKAIHTGEDIAIFAPGPTLSKYKPINGTVNIGVNKAIFFDKVKLQYYFAVDYAVTKSYLKDLINYPEIKKFYGVLPYSCYGYKKDVNHNIIPEDLIQEQKASKFYIYKKRPILPMSLNTDIDKTWLADGESCIFPTMQFALYTNPKRIYLVGCDCSSGYFDQNNKKIKKKKLLYKIWSEFKEFKDIYYPNIEIISVNPVGLRGLFTDLDQE